MGSSPLSSLPRLGCRGGSLATSLSLRRPPLPAVRVPMTSARSTIAPPRRPESAPPTPHPRMPPRADVALPGSCPRGECQACLMCDETESSEPLRGLGSKGGRGGEEGYKRKTGGVRGEEVQGGRDVGISLITISIRGWAPSTGLGCPCT